MSISPAQNSSSAATRNPLENLLETIERAQTLADADSFEPRPSPSGGGDPLAGLRETIAAEAAHQAETAPIQWYPSGSDDTAVSAPSTAPPKASVTTPPRSSAAAMDQGVEARVGREVLAVLRDQPLSGQARAAAVARLAAQLDDPEPSVLREVLAILVTGQAARLRNQIEEPD